MKHKLSRYAIITEPVDKKKNRILFSSRTNKLLLIPKLTYDYLLSDKIDEIPKVVIERLKKVQAIVQTEENELLNVINENKNAIKKENNETLYEVIQPSANCELDCYYCGQKHSNTNITPLVTDQLLKRIRLKVSKGSFKNLFVSWFGGEPLLAIEEIRRITKELKKLCVEFRINYSCKMVSNGYGFKESIYQEFVQDLNLKQLEITIDGTKHYHDLHRYTKNGEGSFDIILKNLSTILLNQNFKSSDCKISIRCNVDEKNHMSIIPLIELLAEKKLQDKIVFYAVGIHDWGNNAHKIALKGEKFAEYELVWLKKMIELGYNAKFLPKRKKNICIALSDVSDVYDAFGNIFNCTEIPYVPMYYNSKHVLGNLKTSLNLLHFERPFIDWNDNLPSSNFLCKTCKLLPVCGGACPKSWIEGVPPCPSIKYNIKKRLVLFYSFINDSRTDFLSKSENFTN